MNPLVKWCIENNVTEVEAMNALQDQGVISDNCVWFADIYEGDWPAALKFLESTFKKNRGYLLEL
jgi:hypothetical protein